MPDATHPSARKASAAVAHAPRLRMDARVLVTMFATLLVILVLLMGAPIAQAAEVEATQMKVSVWPEYDDPRVLVIYQADLDPSVQLPVDVTFNLPKGAEIGMACEVDAGGGHACKPYQLEDQGDHQSLTYTVESEHTVFFEYYYEAFAGDTEQRDFDFIYRPSFPVTTLTMEVQEPLRSSGFELDPSFSRTTTDSAGLTYHLQEFQDVAPGGDPTTVSVSYSKSDSDPSIEAQSNEDGATGGGTAATGDGGMNSGLLVVVAVIAFAGLLFGGYKVFRPAPVQTGRKGRGPSAKPAKKTARGGGSPHDKPAAGRGGKRSGGDRKFCTECGAELDSAAKFCSECGEGQA